MEPRLCPRSAPSLRDLIGRKDSEPLRRPFAVIMKNTDLCNYHCEYCYVENHCTVKMMSLETAKLAIRKVLDYVDPRRKVNFIWHGGEPLLAGRGFFESVAEHCVGFCRVIENCIQTNGSLLTREFLRFCRDAKFTVSISIDGPPAFHDINRHTAGNLPTHEVALQAIELIKEAGLVAGCVCVLSKVNVEHIDELYEFFREHRVHVRINPVVRSGRAVNAYNQLAITPEQYGRAMCRLFDRWISDEYIVQIEPLYTILGNMVAPSVWGCDYGGRCVESIIAVNPDGTLFPCGRFAGLDEFRLGSVVSDEDLYVMAHGEVFRKLLHRSTETIPACRSCDFAEICNGGCMVTAHMATGDVDDPDYYCVGRKMLFGHIGHWLRSFVDSQTQIHD